MRYVGGGVYIRGERFHRLYSKFRDYVRDIIPNPRLYLITTLLRKVYQNRASTCSGEIKGFGTLFLDKAVARDYNILSDILFVKLV